MKKYMAPICEVEAIETKDIMVLSYEGKLIESTVQVPTGETDPEGNPIMVDQKIVSTTVSASSLVNKGV